MNLQNLLNQFLGAAQPGGLVGGATAGGIAALLVGNKKARKFAGKAATVGGAALLGGLAFNAFQNWRQQGGALPTGRQPVDKAIATLPATRQSFEGTVARDAGFQLTLIKAMIAAAHADGHIDAQEQEKIFKALDNMQLDQQAKGLVLDLMRDPADEGELAKETRSLEQKSEVYLAACFAIDMNQPAEQDFLARLEKALALPAGLARELALQANQLTHEAA